MARIIVNVETVHGVRLGLTYAELRYVNVKAWDLLSHQLDFNKTQRLFSRIFGFSLIDLMRESEKSNPSDEYGHGYPRELYVSITHLREFRTMIEGINAIKDGEIRFSLADSMKLMAMKRAEVMAALPKNEVDWEKQARIPSPRWGGFNSR